MILFIKVIFFEKTHYNKHFQFRRYNVRSLLNRIINNKTNTVLVNLFSLTIIINLIVFYIDLKLSHSLLLFSRIIYFINHESRELIKFQSNIKK